MKQHKKILCVFLVAFLLMVSYSSVFAFATVITPDQVESMIREQEAASRLKSSSSAASSQKPVSSRAYSSAGSSAYSSAGSSDVSSEVSSMASSEESSEIVLPSVGSIAENDPLSSPIVNPEANRQMNWIGIVSWACIALGVLVVLIVVFSNRRPPRGGSGRKRYRRPVKTHKKRLLNDKYYRSMKS